MAKGVTTQPSGVAGRPAANDTGAHPGAGKVADLEVLTFDLAREIFALEAILVREVLDKSPETQVPGAPAFVDAVLNFRGRIIPLADLRLAEIAGEQRVDLRQRADIGQPLDAFVDRRRLEGASLPAGIGRMAGELHRMQRHHLRPQPLQRKQSRAVADMAEDDMRLQGEDGRRHVAKGRRFAGEVKGGRRRHGRACPGHPRRCL